MQSPMMCGAETTVLDHIIWAEKLQVKGGLHWDDDARGRPHVLQAKRTQAVMVLCSASQHLLPERQPLCRARVIRHTASRTHAAAFLTIEVQVSTSRCQ